MENDNFFPLNSSFNAATNCSRIFSFWKKWCSLKKQCLEILWSAAKAQWPHICLILNRSCEVRVLVLPDPAHRTQSSLPACSCVQQGRCSTFHYGTRWMSPCRGAQKSSRLKTASGHTRQWEGDSGGPLPGQFDLGHVVEREVDEILKQFFSHVSLNGLKRQTNETCCLLWTTFINALFQPINKSSYNTVRFFFGL